MDSRIAKLSIPRGEGGVNKLLLWDIDGTLVDADGAGKRAFLESFRICWRREVSFDKIDMTGRTDRHILKQFFKFLGIEWKRENWERFFENYERCLPAALKGGKTRVYPGVREILKTAHRREDISLALITGNTREAARIKLEFFDLFRYFEGGAFGNEKTNRNHLAHLALKRVTERKGAVFQRENVFVIGDTPYDIECGKAIGARTIAVGTGFVPVEKLRAHDPTEAFPDFSETDRFFEIFDR